MKELQEEIREVVIEEETDESETTSASFVGKGDTLPEIAGTEEVQVLTGLLVVDEVDVAEVEAEVLEEDQEVEAEAPEREGLAVVHDDIKVNQEVKARKKRRQEKVIAEVKVPLIRRLMIRNEVRADLDPGPDQRMERMERKKTMVKIVQNEEKDPQALFQNHERRDHLQKIRFLTLLLFSFVLSCCVLC